MVSKNMILIKWKKTIYTKTYKNQYHIIIARICVYYGIGMYASKKLYLYRKGLSVMFGMCRYVCNEKMPN